MIVMDPSPFPGRFEPFHPLFSREIVPSGSRFAVNGEPFHTSEEEQDERVYHDGK